MMMDTTTITQALALGADRRVASFSRKYSPNDVRKALPLMSDTRSIDAYHEGADGTPIPDHVAYEMHDPSAEDAFRAIEDRDMVDGLLSSLDERSRYVLVQTVMVGRTSREVADKLNVSRGRVNQIKTRALAQLREVASEREVF